MVLRPRSDITPRRISSKAISMWEDASRIKFETRHKKDEEIGVGVQKVNHKASMKLAYEAKG